MVPLRRSRFVFATSSVSVSFYLTLFRVSLVLFFFLVFVLISRASRSISLFHVNEHISPSSLCYCIPIAHHIYEIQVVSKPLLTILHSFLAVNRGRCVVPF